MSLGITNLSTGCMSICLKSFLMMWFKQHTSTTDELSFEKEEGLQYAYKQLAMFFLHGNGDNMSNTEFYTLFYTIYPVQVPDVPNFTVRPISVYKIMCVKSC